MTNTACMIVQILFPYNAFKKSVSSFRDFNLQQGLQGLCMKQTMHIHIIFLAELQRIYKKAYVVYSYILILKEFYIISIQASWYADINS